MIENDPEAPPAGFGHWQDAEALRRWSFARRSPQQRLDWLVAALTIICEAAEAREVARAGADIDATRDGP